MGLHASENTSYVFDTLVYTVSHRLQVFQTFSCEGFPEVGESYLRADQSIECYTQEHRAYRIYAAVMIFICELMAK